MKPLDRLDLISELEANLWETWSNFGCGPGCTLHDEGDALWFETPIPIIPYNAALRFQVQENVDQRIDTLLDHLHDRHVAFMWVVHPSSLPRDLPARLRERGLREVEVVTGMARSLDDLPEMPPLPEDIDIRKVAAESDVSEYLQLAAWRWGVPDEYKDQMDCVVANFRFGEPGARAHMWQALRDGQPIAKAGSYLADGSAGIYAVVTKREARRLGLATILTLTALERARERGHRTAVLHSTPMAERLYRSMGFETVAEFRVFASEEVPI